MDWGALGDVLDEVVTGDDAGVDFGARYEARNLIGRGGQGEVYRSWDRNLEREVAIKRARDVKRGERLLLAEQRLLARFHHPAIPAIYDRGTGADGAAFVAMELIEGWRLDDYLAQHEVDYACRLALFRGVGEAVAHAHRHGVLHRDLKPENVLVDHDDRPHLIDWGLAAAGGRAVCGSPYFAAPEQLDGQVADRRADVYALGILLYYILSGELPFSRSVRDFHEFRRQRAALLRVALRERCPQVPPAVERCCERAMAAQAGARYSTVDEFLADLERACRPPPRRRRWPLALIGLMVGTVLGALCGAVFIERGGVLPPALHAMWPTSVDAVDMIVDSSSAVDPLPLDAGAEPVPPFALSQPFAWAPTAAELVTWPGRAEWASLRASLTGLIGAVVVPPVPITGALPARPAAPNPAPIAPQPAWNDLLPDLDEAVPAP
ncbi:MAG: serine/threonine-protein kinase [Planctomycetota bacterium]|jgi:hypothetical protein